MATNAFGDEIEAPAQAGRTNAFGDLIEVTPGYQRLANAGKYIDPYVVAAQPSPLEQIGKSLKNQFLGVVDLLKSEGQAATGDTKALDAKVEALANHVTTNWKQATAAYHKGDYSGAVAAAGRAIPVAGDLVDKASTDIVEGRPYEAATDTLAVPLLAKSGELAAEAAAGAPGVAISAGLRAGAPRVGIGVLKAGAGAIADEAGLPYHIGALWGAKQGIPDIMAGLKAGVGAGKQAARDYVMAQKVAANAGRAPLWDGISSETEPATPQQPIGIPGVLPSGKTAGGVQNIPLPLAPAEIWPRRPVWQRSTVDASDAVDAEQPPSSIPITNLVRSRSPYTPTWQDPAFTDISSEMREGPSLAGKSTDEYLAQLRAQLGIPEGQNLGEVKGGRYPKRFAGDDSPIIDSSKRKAGSKTPIANPETITRAATKASANVLQDLPANSVLMSNPKALQAAFDLAEALGGKTNIGKVMKGKQ